jgi:hypothetical protein
MERHTRHNATSHAPGALRGRAGRIAAGLSGLVLMAALMGCGHEADTEAIIFVDSADANWTLPDDYGNGVNTISPALPVLIQVHKSLEDPTPVAGVDITILVSGLAIAAPTLLDPVSGATLDNGFGVYQTQTDDHGSVVVDPVGIVTGCLAPPAEDASISGNLSLGIFIASDSSSWNGNFTYTCKAP